jgi:hypothetical protein
MNYKSRPICAIMLFVLVCLLFVGINPVAFGQTPVSQQIPNGIIHGTVFFNDWKTEMAGALINLEYLSNTGTVTVAAAYSNSSGQYSFSVVPGTYYEDAYYNGTNVAQSAFINVTAGQSLDMNLTTSRALTD